ncbi:MULTISPECIES: hypothetical protein [Chromobacterium]|uniref:Uncharacterized protein n=1 Tax=Chromobacterium aquaticum TaxID=467180 RepID=A0ABV8ZNG1_9NEIS|nr:MULTISPECIES: hypothetical protein [Chromobacterium]KMN33888.1 hypothetical protein VI26_15230 [Chromobacterium sp. LK1]MCD5361730.1 hypothetical protein [Chromobacterium aquaticum]
MIRNETLIFRTLRLLQTMHVQYLEERRLFLALTRESGGEYSAADVHEHLVYMQQNGLLKPIRTADNHTAYALDWGGYDYLDAS